MTFARRHGGTISGVRRRSRTSGVPRTYYRTNPMPNRTFGDYFVEPDDQPEADRREGPCERRAGDRWQARRGPAGARRPALPRPPADRGCARDRQDGPGESDRAEPRLQLPADPVHAGSPAIGRHRPVDLQPEDPGVRVPAGSDHEPGRPGRRDQPGDAEDPVEPARVDGGAPGDDRWHDLRDAGPVP